MRVTKKQVAIWEKDIKLFCVIQCKKCGKIHEIRKKYHSLYHNCKCGNNLIFACLINRLNKVLYKSKFMYSDNCNHFDLYREV